MDLNNLRDEAYAIAREHGWHEEEHNDEHYLMLIITEISEAVQADRKGWHANSEEYIRLMSDRENNNGDLWFNWAFSQQIKGTVEDELADIVIRCLDLTGLRGIDFHYAEILLSEGIKEVQISFTELMFQACEEITYHGYNLAEKLNAIVAGIIAYCKQKNIDIEWFITQKMNYNRLRPYKHGGLNY